MKAFLSRQLLQYITAAVEMFEIEFQERQGEATSEISVFGVESLAEHISCTSIFSRC